MIFKDNTKGLTGDIIEAKEVILDALNPSYSLPEGYYDSGTIIKMVPEELKVSPSVNTEEYVPTEGKVISSVVVNKVTGNATANDVLTGKTFNSEEGIGITGKIPVYNNIAQVLAPNNPSYIIREGYYGDNCDVSVSAQDITIAADTIALTVYNSDKYYKKITVKPTPSEEKTVSFTNANYGEQVIEPSDGKLLKRVYVPGISLETYNVSLQTDAFTQIASGGVLYNEIKVPAVPGTASPGDVLSGKTFSATYGINAKGGMTNYSDTTVTATEATADDTYTYLKTPTGYYKNTSKIRVLNSDLEKLGKIGSIVKKLGNATTYNIAALYPTLWQSLTVNNFKLILSGTVSGAYITSEDKLDYARVSGITPTITYANGIVTVDYRIASWYTAGDANGHDYSSSGSMTIAADLYLIVE